jgi:hypothetical protein
MPSPAAPIECDEASDQVEPSVSGQFAEPALGGAKNEGHPDPELGGGPITAAPHVTSPPAGSSLNPGATASSKQALDLRVLMTDHMRRRAVTK